MEPKDIVASTLQIASALYWLHSRGMYYTDVKTRNVMIRSGEPFNVVLGDCADIKPSTCNGKAMDTISYYSPQLHATQRHQGPLDEIWAHGLTLLNMCAQIPQYEFIRRDRKAHVITELYPVQCAEHARISKINLRHGVVRLIAGMLTWEMGEGWRRGRSSSLRLGKPGIGRMREGNLGFRRLLILSPSGSGRKGVSWKDLGKVLEGAGKV